MSKKRIVRRTPEQVFELWIEALRSGEYKQGRHALCNKDNTFCCLGVLCDLAAKDGGPQWEGGRFMGHYSVLPLEIQLFLGIGMSDVDRLAILNDSGRASFRAIARHIKKHVMPESLARLARRP